MRSLPPNIDQQERQSFTNELES